MTLWQVKVAVLDVITARLRFSYKISDIEAEKVAELMIKGMYSKIAALRLGTYIMSLPQEIQADLERFAAGDDFNPYAGAVFDAMHAMDRYGLNPDKDAKEMMKSRP